MGLEKIEINLPKYQGLQSTAKANINSNIEQRLTFLEKSNLELEQKVSELEKENLDLITQLKAGRGVSAIILKSMDGYYLRTLSLIGQRLAHRPMITENKKLCK